LDDVFNIKDFYLAADGTDWQPAIQRAVDAARPNGGIVYFPAGGYGLSKRVFIGSSHGKISLIGCGGENTGSILNMNAKDYIIYGSFDGAHGPNIGLIQGLVFHNSYSGPDPINIEPPYTDQGTAVTGTGAGVSGVVRVLCQTFIGTPGAQAITLRTGLSVMVGGVGGTTEANGLYKINAPNYDLVSFFPTTQAGAGSGKVQLLANGYDATFGNSTKVGDVITIAGITNVVGGASNEANGSQTVTAVSVGNWIEINVTYVNQGISGTIRGNWVDLVGTTFVHAWTSGGGVSFSGDGSGCVYLGGIIGCAMRECYVSCTTGVGYFEGGFGGTIDNCTFQGAFGGGTSIYNSVGIMSRSSSIRGGKIGGWGIGIAMFKGYNRAEFLDIERCGVGILVGQNPIAYYDSNESNNLQPGQTNNPCAPPGVCIDHIDFEACGVCALDLKICWGDVRNIYHRSSGDQVGMPDYSINCDGAISMDLYRFDINGAHNIAGINVGNARNCEFRYCSVSASGGAGVAWKLPTTQLSNEVRFIDCSIDGALPLNLLPGSGSAATAMLCSNSADPVWTSGGVSNVGKPITAWTSGSGPFKVMARWNGSAWAISG
jgi:hypothetical protein